MPRLPQNSFPSSYSTLETTQVPIDGVMRQLPFKFYLPEVASEGDGVEIYPWVASRVVSHARRREARRAHKRRLGDFGVQECFMLSNMVCLQGGGVTNRPGDACTSCSWSQAGDARSIVLARCMGWVFGAIHHHLSHSLLMEPFITRTKKRPPGRPQARPSNLSSCSLLARKLVSGNVFIHEF